MSNWKYKVQSSPRDILLKLESAFVPDSGFKLNVDSSSSSFKIRKPVRYPDQILHRNRMVVNGLISKTNADNETHVDISFKQDFYMNMTVFSMISFAAILIFLIARLSTGVSMFLFGGVVLAVAFVLWMALQKKLKSDTEKYKVLISEVLGNAVIAN